MAAAIVGTRLGAQEAAKLNRIARNQKLAEARYKSQQHAKYENELMETSLEAYDQDGSKGIEREELKKMLGDFSTSIGSEEHVTDDDVDFMLTLVDQNGGNADGCLQGQEIIAAYKVWFAYLERAPQINALLDKFDVTRNGRLEENEVDAFLTEFNGGEVVPPEVVKWVLEQSDITKTGSLSRMEVARSVAIWYMWSGEDPTHGVANKSRLSGYVDRKGMETLPKHHKSRCCVVC